MKTASHTAPAHKYERIATAIAYIRDNIRQQPSLEMMAARVGLSPWHFQRQFKAWAGVSPKRFLEFLTVHHAKGLIDNSASVLDASLELGLSGPGRLHDQFVSIDAMTPGQYRRHGAGMRIDYGLHPSPFGMMFLALTDRGICELAFGSTGQLRREAGELERRWHGAEIRHDAERTAPTADSIFAPRSGDGRRTQPEFRLSVKGTNFQIRVWRALLGIPAGCAISYKQLAQLSGNPTAARATAGAVAANPVAYLIPCHRVLRSTGELGGYHWGVERKRALLAWDAALAET